MWTNFQSFFSYQFILTVAFHSCDYWSPLIIFIFHCFQSIFQSLSLSFSFFQCIQHITYLFKFFKPYSKAFLTTCIVSSILTHYFLFNQFIHHTLRATWAPCLTHNYYYYKQFILHTLRATWAPCPTPMSYIYNPGLLGHSATQQTPL